MIKLVATDGKKIRKVGRGRYQLPNPPARKPVRRNVIVEDYNDYLQSDHWKEQARQEKEDNPRCSLCNRQTKTLHVHHRTYARLGRELPGDLTVLCDECHRLFHENYEYVPHAGCFHPVR